MRLILSGLVVLLTFAAATKAVEKRQINYWPYHGPAEVEPRQFRPTRTVTTTRTSTLTFTITCTVLTTACPEPITPTPKPPITTTEEPPITTTTEPPITTTTEPPISTTTEPLTTTQEPPLTTTEEPPLTTTAEPPITTTDSIVTTTDSTTDSTTIATQDSGNIAPKQESVREGRAANPQWLMHPPFGYYYHPEEIQSGFEIDRNVDMPYYSSFVQPAANIQPRIFFGLISNLASIFAVTRTETVNSFTFTVSTYTSTPKCSTPGFLQCAAQKSLYEIA